MNISFKTKFNTAFPPLLLTALAAGTIVVALLGKTLPLLIAKALYFCQQFPSQTLFQIPRVFASILVLVLAFSVLIGICSLLVQLRKTWAEWRRFAPRVIALPKRVREMVASLHLEYRVYVVQNTNLFSFCVGVLSPRVVVSTALVDRLADRELEAVLLHEQTHMQNHDPLKVVIGKTVASMFFFLPIFRELNKNMVSVNELLADNRTVRIQETVVHLREAMKKILAFPPVVLSTVPAISNPDSLEVRIRRLVNPNKKPTTLLSSTSIVTTLVFLVFGLLVLRTPVSAFQIRHAQETSYFLCTAGNPCRQQCYQNAQQPIEGPEYLLPPRPTYQAPAN